MEIYARVRDDPRRTVRTALDIAAWPSCAAEHKLLLPLTMAPSICSVMPPPNSGLSEGAYDRILLESQTMAGVDGTIDIHPKHVAEAIQCRNFDRTLWNVARIRWP